MREQVLVLYLAGLLEGGERQLQLVSQYLPLLRETNRELLSAELLQVGPSMCRSVGRGPNGDL